MSFQITFLEFFEALIGCANKLFKPPKASGSDKLVVMDLEQAEKPPMTMTSSENNMAAEQSSTLQLSGGRL